MRRRRWNFEALPVLPEGLSSAPEERLRRMFECFRLSVSYEKPSNLAHVRVSISEDTVEQVLGDGAVLGDGGGEGTNCAALVCPREDSNLRHPVQELKGHGHLRGHGGGVPRSGRVASSGSSDWGVASDLGGGARAAPEVTCFLNVLGPRG